MATVSLWVERRSEVAPACLVLIPQHAVRPHRAAQPGPNHLDEESPAQTFFGEVQTMLKHLGAGSPALTCLTEVQTPAEGVDTSLIQLGRGRD